ELQKFPDEEVRSQCADANHGHHDHQQADSGPRQIEKPIDLDEGEVDEVDRQGDGDDDHQAAEEVLYDPVHAKSLVVVCGSRFVARGLWLAVRGSPLRSHRWLALRRSSRIPRPTERRVVVCVAALRYAVALTSHE